jgi:hypothetical protein
MRIYVHDQMASVRMLPWAKANINPTGQALIVSTVAGMAYFIAADKKILSLARKHSFEAAPEYLFPGRHPPGFLQAMKKYLSGDYLRLMNQLLHCFDQLDSPVRCRSMPK